MEIIVYCPTPPYQQYAYTGLTRHLLLTRKSDKNYLGLSISAVLTDELVRAVIDIAYDFQG